MDTKTKEITKAYDAAHQLNRIASALEEILRLVKKDQEESKKRWEAADQRDEEYDSEVDSEKN
mgnify:CR=1 FL=1